MKDCLFCKIVDNEIPSYILYEDDYFKVFLDINPDSLGHTLIVPKKHIVNALDIEDEIFIKINKIIKLIIKKINNNFSPDGFKILQNNGIVQDIKHYHVHIIPVYKTPPIMNIEDVYNKLKI
ncbi:MAG: HIT domain-containing protein [Bacilli bacterium]